MKFVILNFLPQEFAPSRGEDGRTGGIEGGLLDGPVRLVDAVAERREVPRLQDPRAGDRL